MKKLTNKPILNIPVLLIVLFATGIFFTSSMAQTFSESSCAMTGMGTEAALQLGGMWQTSHDTLNVVVVFVQFPDDMYDTTYSGWATKPIKGEYPGPTYLRTFIDSTRFQMSTSGNLTHFFRQMSMGNFTLIGKARFIVTPHTRQWYISNGWRRWQINMEVLQTLDANFDFAPYDKYKFYSTYDIRKESDGRVDDIFMIYRNVANELPNTIQVMDILGFSPGQNTGYAESSLGYARSNEPISFTVDSGLRRIYHAHPAVDGVADTLGLATTSVLAGSIDSWTGNPPYRPQIHEFAHHWMTTGSSFGHNGAGFWGMLDSWGSRKNSLFHPIPNSWERELLGWISPDSIYQTTYGVTLSDYVTQGDAIKIKVPGTNPNEFFRLEYHLKSSLFDNPEVWDINAKGLYIIHQTGTTDPNSQLRLIPADGRWTWFSDEYVYRPYTSQAIPVLEKTGIDRVNGIDDSRAVPYTWTGGSHPPLANPFWIHVYRDRLTNELIDKTVFFGDGKDAFGVSKNKIFSPWSNPNSQNASKQNTGIAIEVVNEDVGNGVITLNIYFSQSLAQSLSPSKPQDLLVSSSANYHPLLTWAANIEPDLLNYKVYKYITSELGWQYKTTVRGTSYEDISESYCPPGQQCSGGTHNIYYRITAMDNQALESLPSDSVKTTVRGAPPEKISVNPITEAVPNKYSLNQNYPNPFNPVTNIIYQLPKSGLVQLKVYDLLGSEVAVLVNEIKSEGIYNVTFDASNLPSGVYIYSLRVNDFIQNNKMTLLK